MKYSFLALLCLSICFGCKIIKTVPIDIEDNKADFTISQTVSAEFEAERLGLDLPWTDFIPTGLYAPANSVITIEVSQIKGRELPQLLVGTYSRYHNIKDLSVFDLKEGENSINIGRTDGLIFLKYTSEVEAPNATANIKFLKGCKNVPYYKKGETSSKDWIAQLEEYYDVPDVIVESDRVIQVYSMANAKKWKEQNIDLVLNTVDQVIGIEDEISGISRSNRNNLPSIHEILMTETDEKDTYMYATDYRTAFSPDGVKFAFTDLIKTDGWGVWHELGHMHQQADWTWETIDEVTVNIYSLAVEREFGFKESRLIKENAWENMQNFVSKNSTSKDFNDDSQIDVFTRLCMFEQLRMTYGDIFYKKLHQLVRSQKPNLKTDKEKMEYFMISASAIAGYNLSDFFRKWGFKNVDKGYDGIELLKLVDPLNDLTLLTE